MRRMRLAADYETRLRSGRERAVRERRVRKLQTQGLSHARELLSTVSGDANGAAAARRRRGTRVPLSARRGGAAATTQSAAAAAVYVAPNARVVDFAVRRKPYTSTRALEVGIVDEGRGRNGHRLVWLDAADVVLGRGVASRWTSETTSPLTRIRTLKRALRGCVTAAFSCPSPRAFGACDESERVLYGQPCGHGGAARSEFLVCSHDAARNLTPRVPYGVVTGAGSESDWTPGEYARAAAAALRSAKGKCENAKTVAFELCCGSASVSVALAKVVDVVFAIDRVDTRSDAARRNAKIVFVLADAHDWRESLVDVFLEPRRTWRVVFVWASPECRTYSKLRQPKYARKGAEYKEAEQSTGDVLVKLTFL